MCGIQLHLDADEPNIRSAAQWCATGRAQRSKCFRFSEGERNVVLRKEPSDRCFVRTDFEFFDCVSLNAFNLLRKRRATLFATLLPESKPNTTRGYGNRHKHKRDAISFHPLILPGLRV